jgi:hypothetical protein
VNWQDTMLNSSNRPIGQIMLSFAAGMLLAALVALAVRALAQVQMPSASPTPMPAIDVQQMIEWCRQMMSQAGGMMRGMMSGICMGRRLVSATAPQAYSPSSW